MTAATERITVHVTAAEKKRIEEKAKAAGMSIGEYIRRAALTYCMPEAEVVLDQMIQQMNKSTEQMGHVVDDALASIAASNQRINAMEKKAS